MNQAQEVTEERVFRLSKVDGKPRVETDIMGVPHVLTAEGWQVVTDSVAPASFDEAVLTPAQAETFAKVVALISSATTVEDIQAARLLAIIPGPGDLTDVPDALAAASSFAESNHLLGRLVLTDIREAVKYAGIGHAMSPVDPGNGRGRPEWAAPVDLVDMDGKHVSVGDKLSWDFADPVYQGDKIEPWMHQACFVVKQREDGHGLYGDGINNVLYLHGFRFKYCRLIQGES